MNHSRATVIQGHNRYPQTDQLYQPLRKTFLMDTTARKTQLVQASHVSHLSNRVRTHTLDQNIQIAQHTLIFEDIKLRPTHKTWKIPKDNKYQIINVQQKVYQPISQQELNAIMAGRSYKQQQIIVYTVEDQSSRNSVDNLHQTQNQIFSKHTQSYHYFEHQNGKVARDMENVENYHDFQEDMNQLNPTPKSIQQNKIINQNKQENKLDLSIESKNNKQQIIESNQTQNRSFKRLNSKKCSGILVTQPRYNLFSAIDQPLNNILRGKQCTCPTNQLVASKLNEISWYGTIAR